MFELRIILRKNHFVVSRSLMAMYTRECSTFSSSTRDNKPSITYRPIADFYAGKSVFITGGTGFLGKVLIEKLLVSCTTLDKIYVLIRDKKGENVNKRLENMFENPLYSRLEKKDILKKVVPITGDMIQPNLGLTPEDEQTLRDKVSVVFHGAATIKFNEPLPIAMSINFEGTQKILELCQRMKNIQAFVYLSTAYAHTEWRVLSETFYPAPAKLDDVYKFMEEYGHDTEETMKFIKNKPNTYTFTKALTEAYITKNHGDVPTVIIRPSAVTPIKDGPHKGWMDNWFGATPLLYNVATGWNLIHLGDGKCPADFIPVDYVSNFCIVAATTVNKSKIQVYHCTTSSENPLLWSDAYKYFNQEVSRRGKNVSLQAWPLCTESKAVESIGTFFLHKIPAYIADMWFKMSGQEPKCVRRLSQVLSIRSSYKYFTTNVWAMRAERARELSNSLSPEDRRKFPCDPTQINWPEYIRDYCTGVYRYLKPHN